MSTEHMDGNYTLANQTHREPPDTDPVRKLPHKTESE